MKITHFVPHTPESVGYESELDFISMASYYDSYCSRLYERGHEVELAYLSNTSQTRIEREYDVTPLPVDVGTGFGNEISQSAIRYLNRSDANIIHFHGYNQLNVYSFFLPLITSKKTIFHNHGGSFDREKMVSKVWYLAICNSILRAADHVISVNRSELSNIIRFGLHPNKTSFIPNGIDTKLFSPIDKESSRNRLQIPHDETVLLFVGRIEPTKGIEYLIRMVGELKKEHPKIRLYLIYSAKQHREYQKMKSLVNEYELKDTIELVGKVERGRLPMYYNSSDVCVFPSVSEGFGMVTLEAMSCGSAIVGTTAHEGGNHLEHEQNALVAQTRSAKDLQSKVWKLLHENGLRRRIESNARISVVDNFSWETTIDKIEEIYSMTVQSSTKTE